MQPEPTREALIHAVKRMHAARGRYHSQHATCDLYELLGLPCTRETIAPPAALASAPAAEPVSPMAKMAQALRDKAAAEKASFDTRVQSGEWGPAPDAGTEADCQLEHVAQVEGDAVVRTLRWNKNVGAFEYPVGTKLYAASAPLASAPPAEPAAPQASLIVDVYRAEGDDPFICAVHGKATIEVLTQIEEAIREHADFGKGDGVYRYEPEWFAGQFGEYGQCELRPGWGFDEVGFDPPGRESLPQAQVVEAAPAAAAVTDARILEVGSKWSKEANFMDFERNDFISCVRELLTAHGAPPMAGKTASL